MRLSDLDEAIDFYNNNHAENLKEIMVSIDNYKNIVRNLEEAMNIKEPIPEDEILLKTLTYKGISITWGVEMLKPY